jgi:hypothetical protein
MGAADRIGEAIFGRALLESTLPAWAGTAVAILLNMAIDCMPYIERYMVVQWMAGSRLVDGSSVGLVVWT